MAEQQKNVLAPARNEFGQFLQGSTGNMGGRPVGARNKLGEAFIQALHDDFNEHGVEAIVQVREKKPGQYLKVIASLMPRDLNLNFNSEIELTDDELVGRIRDLSEAFAPFLARAGGAAEGDGKKGGAQKPARVH